MTVHEGCEVLGIRRGASFEEIKAAYRERVKLYHPDLNGGRNGQAGALPAGSGRRSETS